MAVWLLRHLVPLQLQHFLSEKALEMVIDNRLNESSLKDLDQQRPIWFLSKRIIVGRQGDDGNSSGADIRTQKNKVR